MLKLGEKGAIPQRDSQTYAVAPHIPCGLITPELLRRLADVAEKYQAQAIKITGATRVAIIGLKEEDIDRRLGGPETGQGCCRGALRPQHTRLPRQHLLQDWASRMPWRSG